MVKIMVGGSSNLVVQLLGSLSVLPCVKLGDIHLFFFSIVLICIPEINMYSTVFKIICRTFIFCLKRQLCKLYFEFNFLSTDSNVLPQYSEGNVVFKKIGNKMIIQYLALIKIESKYCGLRFQQRSPTILMKGFFL